MDKMNNKREERISLFKKAINKMISSSETSYASSNIFKRAEDYTSYTKQQIEDIINSGDPEQLRDLSISFFYASGFYRRFCLFLGTYLKYTPIIIPHMNGGQKKITDKKYKKKYFDSLEFYNNINFEKLCTDFSIKVLVEGAYYGMIFDDGTNKIGIQSLPFEYCRTRFKTYSGIDIVEFNVSYFDTIRDKNKRDKALKNFSNDIRKAYNAYKNRGADKWYMIEPGVGIHFNLYEERPFLLNAIPAIIDFEEYREIEKAKDSQDLKKILVQEMPHTSDGELVFDPEEVEEMHRGVVGMLQRNKDVDVLTSFGEVSLEDMQSARSVVTDNLQKIENIIYSEAGISKEVFAASNADSLEKSLKSDLALMMYLANSYEQWLAMLLNDRYGDNNISFTVKIFPLSYYDNYDFIDKTMDMAQYGYSFLVPSLAIGINQMELYDIKSLENDLLGLRNIMLPLQSSHTQSYKDKEYTNEEDTKIEKAENESSSIETPNEDKNSSQIENDENKESEAGVDNE